MIFIEIYYTMTETEINMSFLISDHTTWNNIIDDQQWITINETSMEFVEDPTTFFLNNPNLLEDTMNIVDSIDSIQNAYRETGARDLYIDIYNEENIYDDTDWYLSD